jgi:hypothetical protein
MKNWLCWLGLHEWFLKQPTLEELQTLQLGPNMYIQYCGRCKKERYVIIEAKEFKRFLEKQ